MDSKEFPDYSVYHLHELELALENLDESAHPDEAQRIRELIEKGGYVYQGEPAIACVGFPNAIYKWALVVILSVLVIFNLIVFALAHYALSLIPVIFQGTILFMIYQHHRYTRMLIKIWSCLLMLSGSFGLLAIVYAPPLVVADFAEHAATLVIGLTFFGLANRCVTLVPVGNNMPQDSATQVSS